MVDVEIEEDERHRIKDADDQIIDVVPKERRSHDEAAITKRSLEAEISAAGQKLLGWRDLPIQPDDAGIGHAARAA